MNYSILQTVFFTTIAVLLFSTCKKDSPIDPSGIEQGIFTAKIDGDEFKSTGRVAVIVDTPFGGENFMIAGGDLANGITSFSVTVVVPVGKILEKTTYFFDENSCNITDAFCGSIIFFGNSIGGTTEYSNGSSMEISFSSIDYRTGGSCIGTFSGVLVGADQSVINVTDGKFNLKIEE